jgi:hypothetical protein
MSKIIDDYIIDYVKEIITQIKIEKAYCLDIAVTDDVPKILETNCINASGLYELDTQKFIMSIEELDTNNNLDYFSERVDGQTPDIK